MNKELLYKEIAKTGYNYYYTCNLHFATYDIIEKVPGIIGIFSMIIGIVQIRFPNWKYNLDVSTGLIIIGVISLYISFYNRKKEVYKEVGIKLTNRYNDLTKLYILAKDGDYDKEKIFRELDLIRLELNNESISNQIFFSNVYAHYKMFIKKKENCKWFEKELDLKLIGDKIPISAIASFVIIFIIIILAILGGKGCL